MIFLDTDLRKVTTLKMYHTSGLWYVRVGNGTDSIDTMETPSIRAAAYDTHTHTEGNEYMPSPKTNHMDTEVINMAINDTPPQQTNSSPPATGHDILQIHSTKLWDEVSTDNAPPLLQQTDTCSESDSEQTFTDSR